MNNKYLEIGQNFTVISNNHIAYLEVHTFVRGGYEKIHFLIKMIYINFIIGIISHMLRSIGNYEIMYSKLSFSFLKSYLYTEHTGSHPINKSRQIK